MQAYILIKCAPGSENKIISEFSELQEIVEINGIWGIYDIFLKIATPDPFGIDAIVKRLRNHPDIISTETCDVLYRQGGTIDHE